MSELAIVEMKGAYFGVVVSRKGVVVRAPPIARWMVGERVERCRVWVRRKGGKWTFYQKLRNQRDESKCLRDV